MNLTLFFISYMREIFVCYCNSKIFGIGHIFEQFNDHLSIAIMTLS